VSPSTIVPGVPAEAGASRASGTLRVTLPVVVSWRRPRLVRGRVRYPATYADEREAWAGAVRAAVATSGWRPLPRARYGVTVTVSGAGGATWTACARPSSTPCSGDSPCPTTASWTR
jgi:hypothetical protein